MGARCAGITVPLDYGDPDGRTTVVAVSRVAATDTAHRIGTMVLVAGGPGDSALQNGSEPPAAMAGIASRFDVVGYDPRFVGRSAPLDCRWPTGHALRSAGLTRRSFERQVAFQRDLADRCLRTRSDLLPYATTRNTARDLDIVRGVLGNAGSRTTASPTRPIWAPSTPRCSPAASTVPSSTGPWTRCATTHGS
ncbi:hypothetical protein GCM10014713_45270 [Streptomyces purpureus]|uniref:Uncharacterized protein n=1 Tax=Streptomyces purpureus TaxID=1951 RepID=A0A918LT56_9ACTN|nr:hypothetical protein GCM10014713_45270 [Streptomyces purpureus]